MGSVSVSIDNILLPTRNIKVKSLIYTFFQLF
jgi:hypothetical protein